MTLALEQSVDFITEYRTESYKRYGSGVTEVKNVLNAKNDLKGSVA